MPNASLLFDPSGGRGIEPFSWPVPPLGARMGYAGGIGPDNLLDVLRAIGPVESPFWIDMESGVRTDDRFDLAKARAVLETAAPFVTGGRS
jgi:phosphoribosylanthranilate isomerase